MSEQYEQDQARSREEQPDGQGQAGPQAGSGGWQSPPPYQQGYPPTYSGHNYYPPPQGQYYQGYPPQTGYHQQYGAWQQPAQQRPPSPSKAEEKYQWRFEDYEKLDKSTSHRGRKRGLVVFAVCLICMFAVGLVALSGYSIYASLQATPQEEPGAVVREPEDTAPALDPPDTQLNINSRPDVAASTLPDGKLTTPQVAQLVTPSVVGVIKYQSAQFLEATGAGSGIIMSENGYIITNAHVVENADTVVVYLGEDDSETYEAVIVGSDRQTDLAVLKIEAEGLIPAQFGNSDELEVGEVVVAIGNPAGTMLSGSVTQGIVSAVNRQVATATYTMTYIQTDAAINPGNSGGALVNEFGQVVGINSSKILEEGYEGIAFAIPINHAQPIITDLIENGRVTGRVMLGIMGEAINEVVATYYDVPMGIQIVEIRHEGLSDAGARERDIITHINGERVYNLNDVRSILGEHQVGDRVTLTLYRQISVRQNSTFDIQFALVEDMG